MPSLDGINKGLGSNKLVWPIAGSENICACCSVGCSSETSEFVSCSIFSLIEGFEIVSVKTILLSAEFGTSNSIFS